MSENITCSMHGVLLERLEHSEQERLVLWRRVDESLSEVKRLNSLLDRHLAVSEEHEKMRAEQRRMDAELRDKAIQAWGATMLESTQKALTGCANGVLIPAVTQAIQATKPPNGLRGFFTPILQDLIKWFLFGLLALLVLHRVAPSGVQLP